MPCASQTRASASGETAIRVGMNATPSPTGTGSIRMAGQITAAALRISENVRVHRTIGRCCTHGRLDGRRQNGIGPCLGRVVDPMAFHQRSRRLWGSPRAPAVPRHFLQFFTVQDCGKRSLPGAKRSWWRQEEAMGSKLAAGSMSTEAREVIRPLTHRSAGYPHPGIGHAAPLAPGLAAVETEAIRCLQ